MNFGYLALGAVLCVGVDPVGRLGVVLALFQPHPAKVKSDELGVKF